MSDMWTSFRYWLYRHIGALGETSQKHRSAILLLSALMFFVAPDVILKLGTISLSGLGITIEPHQTVSIGLFLFTLLLYRLIAFWASVLIESGVDEKRASSKAQYEVDPASSVEERADDMDQLIRQETHAITYKWTIRRLLWDIGFPNAVATISIARYGYLYFSN